MALSEIERGIWLNLNYDDDIDNNENKNVQADIDAI